MFRLNVGQVEVCTLEVNHPLHFLVCLHDDLPEMPVGVRVWTNGPYVYKAIPIASASLEIDVGAKWPLPHALVDAHLAFVNEAASRRNKTTFAGAFSIGALRYIESVLGETLPRPRYFEDVNDAVPDSPGELTADEALYEGGAQLITVNRYEREPRARRACIEHHGAACSACGLRFGEVYGPMMDGFIHVHHVRPLSEAGDQHTVDPIEDLRPVCPNCHAALHARRPPLSIEELRELLANARHASRAEH